MIAARSARLLFALALCLAAAGCRHRAQPPQLPVVAQAPVPLAKTPETPTPQLQPVPLQPAPVEEVQVKPPKPRRPSSRKTQVARDGSQKAAAAPAAPVQVASADAAPAASVIGALTPGGGDQTPERKQKAMDLIADLMKRLGALKTEVVETQKEQVERVRNFEKEAQAALRLGDAEGAMTLATKAKLLLDDLEK